MRMGCIANYLVLLPLIAIKCRSFDLPSTDKNLISRDSKHPIPGDSDVATLENISEPPDDNDEIKGFAVFVDSPDSEEPPVESGESAEELDLTVNGTQIDVEQEDDDALLSETSMKEILSKKFQNGSVIHDIRIVVKHPQNFKGNNRKKGKGGKIQKKSHKKISAIHGRKSPLITTSPSYSKTTRKLDNNNQTYSTLPGTVNGNCSGSSCPGQMSVEYSEEDPIVYSQWQWTMLTGEMRSVNFTVNTTGTNTELASNKSLIGKPHSKNITGDKFVGVETGTGTKLYKDQAVQTETEKCSSNIYLNLTNSDSCVSKCLISCVMSKNVPMIPETSDTPKENVRVHEKSSSEGSVSTDLAGVEEHHGTERTGFKLNSEIHRTVTSNVSTTLPSQTTTEAPLKKNFSTYKSQSKGNSIGMNLTGVGENVTELEGIQLNSKLTIAVNNSSQETTETVATGPTDDLETNLHVLVGSEIKHNLVETSDIKKSDLPYILKDICLTETCVMKAADILKRMNSSADPCVNFFEFACGRFLKKEIPEDYMAWSVYHEIAYDVLHRMGSVLVEPAKTSDLSHVTELKRFHSTCLKSTTRRLMLEFLEELGGWPAPHSPSWKLPSRSWEDIAFNWTHGQGIEHNFVLLGISNKTGELLGISVELPGFVKEALKSNGTDVLALIEYETAAIAIALGVDNDTIVDSIGVLRLFMHYALSYANVSQSREAYYTLRELKQKFPHLPVLKSLSSLLEKSVGIKIDDEEVILVSDVAYLQKIDILIRDTPVKTQMALLVMSAMRALYNLIKPALDHNKVLFCTKLTWELYPSIVSNVYSVNFVDDKMVNGVVKILSQVKNSIEKALAESTLDGKIASIALDRLKSLTYIVSLQNRHDREFGRTGLAELVDKLNSSFALMVKAGIGNYRGRAYTFLHTSYKSSLPHILEIFADHKYQVNSFVFESYVFIPFTLMHENIYNEELPSYTNFAGIGIVLGHELVHGVSRDDLLRNSSKFLVEEQCLIDQFSDFTVRYLGLPVDGKGTKNENIADLGGFREAYLAYTNWARHHSENELRLPGLHRFNNRQMFWLTAASNWCHVATREAMAISLHQDEHAPAETRVNGQLANLPEFSRDFHCPLNSPMNPKEKCSLW
uniref:Membrane metallo-endopeptidase-like 1 n=1 Tax=Lygus hesperus TaxID=30085 RepID=A0A0K8SRE1_LYGHE